MRVSGGRPRMRRIQTLVFASLIATPLAVLPAIGQTSNSTVTPQQNSSQIENKPYESGRFASSSLMASDAEPAAPSFDPAPAVGAGGQSYQSYGSHATSRWSHLAFEAGGGVNAPIGNDTPFITWGGNLTVGAGLRVGSHLSGLIEYQFIDDKLPGGLIADAGAQGGNAHIWSVTLDPVFDLFPKRNNDMYLTGGGGFYRKVTNFTDPEETYFCSYFCYPGYENVTVSHFSSNQGGANFGVGLTHRIGSMDSDSDGRMKIFAEARYLWIDTPPIGTTNGLGRTELIPVTAGLRW
jgi:hypothetical protein